MHLAKLKIENLRSIEGLEIDFCNQSKTPRTWTVLLGMNGTAKSNVLRAIALVASGPSALAELLGEPDEWIRRRAPQAKIVATFKTKAGEARTLTLTIKRGQTAEQVVKANRRGLVRLIDALDHTARSYFVAGYGSARTNPPDGSEDHLFADPRARGVGTLFRSEARLMPIERWAGRVVEEGHDIEGIVRDTLKDLLPDVTFHRFLRKTRTLMFKTPDGLVPLRNLGGGYQAMVAWLGDLLHRISLVFRDYGNPLAAHGILLIDELDLHLHPVWQRRLLDFLRERLTGLQIIATTQSPLSAQQCNEGELWILHRVRPTGPVEVEEFVGNPQYMRLEQLLRSPAFGLESTESEHVQQLRQEYRDASKGLVDPKNLARMRKELEGIPDPSRPTELEEKLAALVSHLSKEVKGSGPVRRARRKLKKSGPVRRRRRE
jgi:predicted ATPase